MADSWKFYLFGDSFVVRMKYVAGPVAFDYHLIKGVSGQRLTHQRRRLNAAEQLQFLEYQAALTIWELQQGSLPKRHQSVWRLTNPMPTFEFPRPDKNLGTLADVSSNQFQ
jgi:hypothetical protein